MALYPIRKLWCPILGDVISGSIHPELLLTNQLPDPAAAVLASRLMGMFFSELKPLGLPIEIDAVQGNHARTSLKMPTKAQAATNLDWVVYCALEDRFKDDDQIKVTVHTSQITLKKIYGWRLVIEHGINVRSGKEEDLEDSIRALFDDATFRQATGLQGASFDQLILGHEHRAKLLERVIVNGGYSGQSELGQSWRLAPVRAQQCLWGMSKKQVRTWAYNLDLTDIKSSKPENPFSEYSSWFVRRYGKP
jgi:predicted phosphodiesterase